MAQGENSPIGGLIRGLVEDTRELIREEIALAKTELLTEVRALQRAGVAFGGAALLAILGAMMFCIALGGVIAWTFDWPAWAGYGVVMLLLCGGAFALVQVGRRRLSDVRGLPKTVQATKENVAWIQNKSVGK